MPADRPGERDPAAATTTPGRAGRPAESFLAVAPDGAWCWFADPRAVWDAGPGGRERVYAGWVDRAGSIWIGAVEIAAGGLAAGAVRRHRLHDRLDPDDHASPTLLLRDDGHLLVFYSRHDGDAIYCAESAAPGDITAWHPARVLRLNSPADNARAFVAGSDSYTYPAAYQLRGGPGGAPGRIALFWRGLGYKPNMATSDDGGRTFTPGRIAIAAPGGYEDQRPYTKMRCDARGAIHIAMTDGHPAEEPQNGVYYACWRDGAFWRADGTPIAWPDALPFSPRDADCVHAARPATGRAWVWDVAADRHGHPAIVYARFPDPADHRYCYARWDGARWHHHEIAAAGPCFVRPPAGEVQPEPYYSPGLVLDGADPDTVYASLPAPGGRREPPAPRGRREIVRCTTRDLGATWDRTPITAGSASDSVRPFVAAAPGGRSRVLWMELVRYAHYTAFESAIRIDLPAPGE